MSSRSEPRRDAIDDLFDVEIRDESSGPTRERRISRRALAACAACVVAAAALGWTNGGGAASLARNSREQGGASAPSAPASSIGFEPMRELEVARYESSCGDDAAARRRLFALLAVVDGIPDPERRRDVEARASFAIARTYEPHEVKR